MVETYLILAPSQRETVGSPYARGLSIRIVRKRHEAFLKGSIEGLCRQLTPITFLLYRYDASAVIPQGADELGGLVLDICSCRAIRSRTLPSGKSPSKNGRDSAPEKRVSRRGSDNDSALPSPDR